MADNKNTEKAPGPKQGTPTDYQQAVGLLRAAQTAPPGTYDPNQVEVARMIVLNVAVNGRVGDTAYSPQDQKNAMEVFQQTQGAKGVTEPQAMLFTIQNNGAAPSNATASQQKTQNSTPAQNIISSSTQGKDVGSGGPTVGDYIQYANSDQGKADIQGRGAYRVGSIPGASYANPGPTNGGQGYGSVSGSLPGAYGSDLSGQNADTQSANLAYDINHGNTDYTGTPTTTWGGTAAPVAGAAVNGVTPASTLTGPYAGLSTTTVNAGDFTDPAWLDASLAASGIDPNGYQASLIDPSGTANLLAMSNLGNLGGLNTANQAPLVNDFYTNLATGTGGQGLPDMGQLWDNFIGEQGLGDANGNQNMLNGDITPQGQIQTVMNIVKSVSSYMPQVNQTVLQNNINRYSRMYMDAVSGAVPLPGIGVPDPSKYTFIDFLRDQGAENWM